ncbi:hypothetical protein BS78_02G164300 [Paspalum vaginatum]|nr:hypothetical protein BS78_02G164300 [Paspalum vaginatum]
MAQPRSKKKRLEKAKAMAQGQADSSVSGGSHARARDESAVCMEPVDWVAVGPCGHRMVCVNCAVRMRAVDRNLQCCICRTLCPTVVVTKPQQGATTFSRPPLAGGGAGQVGMYLSYHDGMAAYFDDRGLYEKVKEMCPIKPSPAADDLGDLEILLPCLVGAMLMGMGATLFGPLATTLLTQWHHRILASVAFALVFCCVCEYSYRIRG